MQILTGTPSPLGISWKKDVVNFAVFSQNATKVFLGLFAENQPQPIQEIPLQRTGDIWHVAIEGFSFDKLSYAYRCEGPYDPQKGLVFKSDKWVIDPYAKSVWVQRAMVTEKEKFDWQRDRSPKIPLEELVIYEMHVRGFTKHPSSGVTHPGTYLGMIEKIPYLKELGINCVELLPIFEFDETVVKGIHPKTGQPLHNYWGYDPIHFFVPKQKYAVEDGVKEFKTLVRELHKNGIEVILDVVFNHTGEGQDINYYVNFRGLDNSVYYQLGEQGAYLNFSGCGNTLNTNHPIVQQFILDTLRYWVEEMHVDGFRFDSAAIFARDEHGNPLPDPPILQAIASDPVLRKVKLIAEPWDAAGLSLVGFFAKKGPWSEWNCYYRDFVRRFIKGTDGQAPLFAKAISGSEQIYHEAKTPLRSVNYVVAHDGFCLRDLVTYQQKHNEENGENNRDGIDTNDSWNCGVEGPTDDKNILELRERQMRNFLLALFFSQGIPMLLMGTEYGHTCHGNNNPYTQDNEMNWFLWDQQNKKIFDFVSSLIAFRKNHPELCRTRFLTPKEIEWQNPDWSDPSRFVAFSLKNLYVAFNANSHPVKIKVPQWRPQWRQVVNTAQDWDQHSLRNPKKGDVVAPELELAPYAAVVLYHSR